MLLVNPRRRRKGRARSRRRNPRRRRMSAKQAMYFGGGRRKRRRNPSARRRRRGRRSRARRGYRRNPIRLPGVGGISRQIMGAVPGALGALGLDVLLGVLPIPAAWKAGTLGYVTKILGAVGLGMVAKSVVSGSMAAEMTQGALTVMFHGIMRDFVATNVPQVPLGVYLSPRVPTMNGMGYYGSGWNPSNMGAYLPDLSAGAPIGFQMHSMDTDTFGANY